MLKINLLILFTGLIFFSCTHSKEENKPVWDNSLSVEGNVAAQALAFENDSTFPFLDGIMKNRSVLFLGEAGHDDITTTRIKVNMISYLENKGVHSALFEMSSFLQAFVLARSEYNDYTKDWQVQNIFHFWSYHPPFQSLLEKINNRQIKAFGIDCYTGIYDIEAVKIILRKYLKEYPFVLDWDKLYQYYMDRFYSYKEIPEKEQVEMMQMIDSISIYTQYLINKKGKDIDLEAILQWQRNINTLFSQVLYLDAPYRNSVSDESFDMKNLGLPSRNRDSQMAENILWVAEHFPDEKFTVWAANFHGAKDISLTIYPKDSLLYFVQQCTGEGVYNKLGDKFYSLAITSLHDIGREDMPTGLLEEAIAKETGNAPYAFIDFEPLRFADGFRDKEFNAAMINKKRGKWLYIFDGIYYIRDQDRRNVRPD